MKYTPTLGTSQKRGKRGRKRDVVLLLLTFDAGFLFLLLISKDKREDIFHRIFFFQNANGT